MDETLKLGATAYTPTGTVLPLADWSSSPVFTFTIEDDDGKKIRLTSNQRNDSITEGDSGRKSVVLTVTLSEAAPSGGVSGNLLWGTPVSTAKGSNKGLNPCDPPLNPADTDWCLPDASSNFTVAANQTQTTMTVNVIGDTLAESDETVTFRARAAGDWTTANSVTLTIVDDDSSPAGVTISRSVLTVGEGSDGTYTVKLNAAPTGTVTPSSSGAGAASFSPASLTFNSGNYNTAQTVTITGETDDDSRNESVTITHAVTGANYASVTADSVTVTVTDDDAPAAPVLTGATSTDKLVTLTWSHAVTSAVNCISGAASGTTIWQWGYRLKGSTSWVGKTNISISSGDARRTATDGFGNDYPDGAVLEVRIRA